MLLHDGSGPDRIGQPVILEVRRELLEALSGAKLRPSKLRAALT